MWCSGLLTFPVMQLTFGLGEQRNFGLLLIDKCQVLGNTVMESKVKDCLFIVSDQMKLNSVT